MNKNRLDDLFKQMESDLHKAAGGGEKNQFQETVNSFIDKLTKAFKDSGAENVEVNVVASKDIGEFMEDLKKFAAKQKGPMSSFELANELADEMSDGLHRLIEEHKDHLDEHELMAIAHYSASNYLARGICCWSPAVREACVNEAHRILEEDPDASINPRQITLSCIKLMSVLILDGIKDLEKKFEKIVKDKNLQEAVREAVARMTAEVISAKAKRRKENEEGQGPNAG